jgi:hypothetical protein
MNAKQRAATEFRAAVVELQRWVMLHLIIPDGDLATQSQLFELLTSAEAAAMRAGILLDAHEPEKPAFGNRLRIPYHGGLTLVNRKWSGAKVLEAGHSWSVHLRALVKVAERVASGADDWHPETKTAAELGTLWTKKAGRKNTKNERFHLNSVTNKIKREEKRGRIQRLGERGPFRVRSDLWEWFET